MIVAFILYPCTIHDPLIIHDIDEEETTVPELKKAVSALHGKVYSPTVVTLDKLTKGNAMTLFLELGPFFRFLTCTEKKNSKEKIPYDSRELFKFKDGG